MLTGRTGCDRIIAIMLDAQSMLIYIVPEGYYAYFTFTWRMKCA